MFRVYAIVCFFFYISFISTGQGIGDFAVLSNDTGNRQEKTFLDFIHAAREDGDSAKVVIATSLYGRFLMQQQRYNEAEKQLAQALENIEKMKSGLRKTLPLAGVSIYDTYDYLGEFFTETANYKNAEFFFKKSEDLRAHKFSRGSVFRIFNIQKLAQFYIDTYQNELAEAYLNKLIHELKRTRFNSQKLKYAYATYYKGMTEISIRSGRLEEAEKFLKKTFVFYGSPFTSYAGAIRRMEGNTETLLLRSRVLMMKGDASKALQIIETALSGNSDSTNFLPKLLRYKAICLFAQNKIEDALSVSGQLLQINLNNLNRIFPSLSENEKEEFNRRVSYDFNLFNSFVLSATDAKIMDHTILETLVNFRLQSKALLLNNSRKIRQAIFASRDTALINDFRLLGQLKNLASIEAFRKKTKDRLREVNNRIEKLEKYVNYRITGFSQNINRQVTLPDIQRQLQADACAIEIIQTKNFRKINKEKASLFAFGDSTSYLVVLIFKNKIDYKIIHNGDELENRMVKFFKNSVRMVRHDSLLYTAFWKPFAPELKAIRTVYFSADGVYNLINLNLLHNANGYLLDQYGIILLSNLKDMLTARAPYTRKTGAFIGHPQYKLNDNEDIKPVEAGQSVNRALRAALLEDIKSGEFPDLPGTENEVSQGAAILNKNGWRIKKITGQEADERHVKEIQNPALLHLATHGFFIEQSWGVNPMLRSGLIFSGVKNQEIVNNEDGILTAYEASSLVLDSTRLVVLSACETGSGEVKNGEGVYGLQRAFMIAGADNIIMSLWKVDDTATQKLMNYFYAGLVRSNNVRLAFTEAQRTLRKEYPEPLYWGAFVLLGM